jgi:hypothetical protein
MKKLDEDNLDSLRELTELYIMVISKKRTFL